MISIRIKNFKYNYDLKSDVQLDRQIQRLFIKLFQDKNKMRRPQDLKTWTDYYDGTTGVI